MLSKNKIKYIRSLELRKFRKAEGLFVAEGGKVVGDLLGALDCACLIAVPDWLAAHASSPTTERIEDEGVGLAKASFLKTPPEVMGLFRLPSWDVTEAARPDRLVLALDGVQDPGNLGTIVRLAAWFGIGHIVCSEDTADVFSPKAVQATMGTLARVQVHYAKLPAWLESLPKDIPVYGTFLDGEDLQAVCLSRGGILVMGNEGRGIRPDVERLISRRLYISPYPADKPATDSLNVAVATALACAEFRRRLL
jgi:TrmH family RNA methyltransferase